MRLDSGDGAGDGGGGGGGGSLALSPKDTQLSLIFNEY